MKQVPISRIKRFMSLPANAPVRLYSNQGQQAWDKAEEQGFWSGNEDPDEDDVHPFFRPAYAWMQGQMAKHIPDYSGDLPMWAWFKRPSAKNKPKKYRGSDERFRLTVVVPRSRVLLSDYETWHSVLNNNRLCLNEEEWDQWCHEWPQHWSDTTDIEGYRKSVEPSWERCLDFNPTLDKNIIEWGSSSPKYFRVQACVDRFYWSEIESVRNFTQFSK